ncbi:TPA: hypothetical protein U1C34_001021 [Streptococcus suis]|uniref:hypothetical protein n=1 Tax=Streptococcus suis TaxID=1307 RepID=UPI001ABE1853|nr:hypothetical protein [Streptococcus suis]MBO4110838.1 hypothetical protein [Streptococcus suis]HEM3613042.1 hypothetical protein [Streptococcus suis]HEM3615406.1 hypothetical protein [Streptococcus suis]HEM3622239.1 hypothetical protein [Streptococcus suis]HEM3627418.1 hypothetical protein [Streptococcus suis]
MSNNLSNSQIFQRIKEYCLLNEVTHSEDEIKEWTDDLVNIIYSIGGTPTDSILQKMLPEYFRIINKLE